MADTMATPYSDWLLLILRRNGLKRQNYYEMNDMPAPIAISSNGAKSLIPRRHLAFIRRWGFGTRQPQKDQCRTDAEKNPTLCRRGCNPPARFPKRAQPDRAPSASSASHARSILRADAVPSLPDQLQSVSVRVADPGGITTL